ncbi:FtsX-like permease family protein [Micromonospora orduensis]|uniref:FtsX-like permease family protein n=1 Tax=Micromonospora orduensis TaxID=1420891 RepID=A0A5C4QVB9_9ACTN|nr:FtsX-like permease family protein [Micromonospora orduensis]TNH29950.1 FtsX-like permease family protein [Micromonospora orduensis]
MLPPAARTDPPSAWLVDAPTPVGWDQVGRLNAEGLLVISRAVLLDPPPVQHTSPSEVDARSVGISVLLGGLSAMQIVLLAGPAFAIGARRRQRDLALVAANGGSPAHLRRIVLADGVVLGLIGAVIGILLGAILAVAGRPLVEEHLAQARGGGYRFFPLALLAVAGLAVLTGVVAALVPAIVAARQNVVVALTGRRGATRSRRRWVAVGLVLAAGGSGAVAYAAVQVSTNLLLAGLMLTQLGLVLCTPALVGLLARLGQHLPLTPRIAYVVDGTVTVQPPAVARPGGPLKGAKEPAALKLPGYTLATGIRSDRTIISPSALARAGLITHQWGFVIATPAPATAAEDRLRAEVGALSTGLRVDVERGPARSDHPILLILMVAAGLITLGAVGIATGLTAADSRPDLSTLAAVGASPLVRRKLSLSQSGTIACLGSLLGMAVGLVGGVAILTAVNQTYLRTWPSGDLYPIVVPWSVLGALAVVPLVAMLGAGLLTRSRLPIERRID